MLECAHKAAFIFCQQNVNYYYKMNNFCCKFVPVFFCRCVFRRRRAFLPWLGCLDQQMNLLLSETAPAAWKCKIGIAYVGDQATATHWLLTAPRWQIAPFSRRSIMWIFRMHALAVLSESGIRHVLSFGRKHRDALMMQSQFWSVAKVRCSMCQIIYIWSWSDRWRWNFATIHRC